MSWFIVISLIKLVFFSNNNIIVINKVESSIKLDENYRFLTTYELDSWLWGSTCVFLFLFSSEKFYVYNFVDDLLSMVHMNSSNHNY